MNVGPRIVLGFYRLLLMHVETAEKWPEPIARACTYSDPKTAKINSERIFQRSRACRRCDYHRSKCPDDTVLYALLHYCHSESVTIRCRTRCLYNDSRAIKTWSIVITLRCKTNMIKRDNHCERGMFNSKNECIVFNIVITHL